MIDAVRTELTELIELTDGVWVAWDPVKILGTHLTTTMTLLRLADGSLLVHSPVSLTPARHAAVRSIGPVAHIYAPNLFHHLHAPGWVEAFPDARVHGPLGLEKKRPDLRLDRAPSSGTESGFSDTVDEIPIDGFRLRETALFHRPSKALVVADLVHNIGRPPGAWTRTYARMMGFYDRVALSRALRWTAFSDRKAARTSIDALLSLPIERIVVGHGAPLEQSPARALSEAFSWLSATPH
jgi:hypothetical protein